MKVRLSLAVGIAVLATGSNVYAQSRVQRQFDQRFGSKSCSLHVAPDVPFGWFDSPPGLNRLLGVQWLARVFYPKLFPEPLGPRIAAFHRLYYHREPTDKQVRALLEIAGVSQ